MSVYNIGKIVYTVDGFSLFGYDETQVLWGAGGLPATLPLEEECVSEKTGEFFKEYIMRSPRFTGEERYCCFRMIDDFIASQFSSSNRISGIHGGGLPIMEKIAILGNCNLDEKEELARRLAGIIKEE